MSNFERIINSTFIHWNIFEITDTVNIYLTKYESKVSKRNNMSIVVISLKQQSKVIANDMNS